VALAPARALMLVGVVGLGAGPALAQGSAVAAASAPVTASLNLSASATVEVPRDLMTVTFSTTRESHDAATVQAQLKQAIEAALAEARKAARPGQIEVQTGGFSLSPRYSNKGLLNGWQGSAELIVEGRDLQGIGQLVGRLSTLTVARVGYGLSRETREKAELEASAQAIARYRAKAAEYSQQFGAGGYELRDVSVSLNQGRPDRPEPMMRGAPASMEAQALPVEAGRGQVTVLVHGSVHLR
jgi:predicted secreted protein